MNILFIGDIFAAPGPKHRSAPRAANHYGRENRPGDRQCGELRRRVWNHAANRRRAASSGIDALTTGNHIWDKKEIFDYLPSQPRLLRPANYSEELPGSGLLVTKSRRGGKVAVMNLQGRTYMPQTDCPFRKADQLIASLEAEVKVRFVDFHTELTSEKMAMGWHLNGRVSAMIGTHTHIPTADERILQAGRRTRQTLG